MLFFVCFLQNYIQDWTIAVRATRAEQIVVISFAVRISVTLEEVSSSQFLITVIASEMLRMPCLAQSCDDLADYWLVASAAAALLFRVYTLSWHIGLKVSKHILKLIASGFALVERCFHYSFFARLIMRYTFRRLHVISDWLLLMLLLRRVDLAKESEVLWNNLQGNCRKESVENICLFIARQTKFFPSRTNFSPQTKRRNEIFLSPKVRPLKMFIFVFRIRGVQNWERYLSSSYDLARLFSVEIIFAWAFQRLRVWRFRIEPSKQIPSHAIRKRLKRVERSGRTFYFVLRSHLMIERFPRPRKATLVEISMENLARVWSGLKLVTSRNSR